MRVEGELAEVDGVRKRCVDQEPAAKVPLELYFLHMVLFWETACVSLPLGSWEGRKMQLCTWKSMPLAGKSMGGKDIPSGFKYDQWWCPDINNLLNNPLQPCFRSTLKSLKVWCSLVYFCWSFSLVLTFSAIVFSLCVSWRNYAIISYVYKYIMYIHKYICI